MGNKKTTFDKLYNRERKRKKNKIKIKIMNYIKKIKEKENQIKIKFMGKSYMKKMKKIVIKEIKRSVYQKEYFFINVEKDDLKKVDLALGNILYLIEEEINNLYFQNFAYKEYSNSFSVYSTRNMNKIFEDFYKIKQEKEEEVKN